MDVNAFVAECRRLAPQLEVASPRLFGQWFGRPMDGNFRVAKVRWEEASRVLRFAFAEGEAVVIEEPEGFAVSERELRIERARRVTLTHQPYGEPRAAPVTLVAEPPGTGPAFELC